MLSVLLSVIGHRRLRVYIINARDGISEVVVGSERVPDQFLHEDAGDVVPFCLLQGGTEQQMQCRGAEPPRPGPKPDIVSAPYGPHGPKRKHGVTLPTITNGLLLPPTEVRTL